MKGLEAVGKTLAFSRIKRGFQVQEQCSLAYDFKDHC